FIQRSRLRRRCGPARAQQHQSGEHREADQREGQRQRAEMFACHRDALDEGVCGASWCIKSDAKDCESEGGNESAPLRTRTWPLVRRPDCLRHYDLPQECERRPPCHARIGRLYLSEESRRKSPDREQEREASTERGYFVSARLVMSSILMRLSAVANTRSASAKAGRTTSLISDESGSGGSPSSSVEPAARRTSSALTRRFSRASS